MEAMTFGCWVQTRRPFSIASRTLRLRRGSPAVENPMEVLGQNRALLREIIQTDISIIDGQMCVLDLCRP